MFVDAPDEEIVDLVGQMHGVSNAALRFLLAGVLEVDQRQLWRADGVHSTESWLTMRHSVAAHTARAWVRVARGLVFCPTLADRFESGHLSWDQLVACVDLVAFGRVPEAEVAADAVGRSAAELDRLARDARKVARLESEERQRKRYLRMRWGRGDGMLRGSFALAEAEGKAFEIAIRRGAEDQPHHPSSNLVRPFEERQADALSDLASARLAADADPDLATVVVHVDAAVVCDPSDAEDAGLASIQLGPLVSRSTALRLCCDGRVQLVIDDESGNPVHVSKTTHAVSPWARRHTLDRDRGCRWYGCDRTALLHIHHITWWTNGGLTELSNLVALCSFHHRLVHEGGWAITGDPAGRMTITNPQGWTLQTGPPGLRDDVRDQLGLRWNTDPPTIAA